MYDIYISVSPYGRKIFNLYGVNFKTATSNSGNYVPLIIEFSSSIGHSLFYWVKYLGFSGFEKIKGNCAIVEIRVSFFQSQLMIIITILLACLMSC